METIYTFFLNYEQYIILLTICFFAGMAWRHHRLISRSASFSPTAFSYSTGLLYSLPQLLAEHWASHFDDTSRRNFFESERAIP